MNKKGMTTKKSIYKKYKKKIGIMFVLSAIVFISCNHHKRVSYKSYYYPDGKIKAKFSPKNNKHRDTLVYNYYENGAIESKYTYRSHLMQDTFYNFNTKGMLTEKLVFDSGKLNGIAHYYYENGTPNATGHYKNNLKTGEWIYFDSLNNGIVDDIQYDFILNNQYFVNKEISFKTTDSTLQMGGQYYTVIPKMTAIVNKDTLYTFIINIIRSYKNMHKYRIIFGNLGRNFSDFSHADTVYPQGEDQMIVLPQIDVRKFPQGIVQFYRVENKVTTVSNSFFYLNPVTFQNVTF